MTGSQTAEAQGANGWVPAVWAPTAAVVDVHYREGEVAGGVTIQAMKRGAAGWWHGPPLPPGADYAFAVDGGPARPDPRSPWQPHGVHGFSRHYDPQGFAWSDSHWQGRDATGAVQYELHVGTFTAAGTLDAIDATQLRRLAEAGIEMIELMPVAAFPGDRGWGYDGVGLFAVHHAYGGPAALQRFVDRAHAVGLAVCLDVVYNHLGPDGNYLATFGPYFTDAHETPWGWAVNLDRPGSEGARRFILDNAARWFRDFHVDALRLDAVHAMVDDSPRHVLAELAAETATLADELGRPLSLIAESDRNDPRTVTPLAEGGLGMTAQWADDVHHALHAYLTGERHGYYVDFGSIDTLDKALRDVFVHDGSWSTFRRKVWGAPLPPGVDRRRFVVFASNHDQVGNRAMGDRPAASLSAGAEAAALAIVLLGPFTPMLFMGEEWGATSPFLYFTDHDEPLGAAVTAGRVAEFADHGWEAIYGREVTAPDPQDPATFRASRLDRNAQNPAVVAWMSAVMSARPGTLDRAAWERHPVRAYEDGPRRLVVAGPVGVRANLSREPWRIEEPVLATFGAADRDGSATILGADSVALVAPEEGSWRGTVAGRSLRGTRCG